MNCRRCGHERTGALSSMFDGELICRACHDREKQHPDYSSAFDAMRNAIEKGDFRYAGIGLPNDLKVEPSVEE